MAIDLIFTVYEKQNVPRRSEGKHSIFIPNTFLCLRRLEHFTGALRNPEKVYFPTQGCREKRAFLAFADRNVYCYSSLGK